MRVASAIVAAACLAAVGACGEEDDPAPPSVTPAELLSQAALNPAASGEADIDIDLDLEGDTPLAGSAGFEAAGPFDLGDGTGFPAFELDGEGTAAGFGFDTDVISTGDDAFVIFFGENYRVGPERVAEAEAALVDARAGKGLGLDVPDWFNDPAYAGSEEVAGADTEKVEGTLDVPAAVGDLTRLARAAGAPPFLVALAEGAGSGPVEAWVSFTDDEGGATFRRLRVQFPFTVPPDQLALTRGIESGTVTIDAEIANVGADVTIGVPEGGGFQPIDDLTRRLESLASLGL